MTTPSLAALAYDALKKQYIHRLKTFSVTVCEGTANDALRQVADALFNVGLRFDVANEIAPMMVGHEMDETRSHLDQCTVYIQPLNHVWIALASDERNDEGELLSSADVAVIISEGAWSRAHGGLTASMSSRKRGPPLKNYTSLGDLVTSYASSDHSLLVDMLFRRR